MLNCPRCGIAFEKELEFCPLCFYGKATQTDSAWAETEISHIHRKEKVYHEYTMLSGKQKRKLFWEISSMVMLSGIMVTVVIDLITNRNITWSKYTITICMVLLANFTLISFLRHRIIILLLGSFVCTSLLLVLLDFYNETMMGWGTRLGIPLLFSLYVVICILIFIFRKNNQHGLNMLGTIFLAIGLLTMCVDAIIGVYIHGRLTLQWSLIVVVCLLPVAGLMFYIHYRLNKGADLRRFFHI